MKNFYYSSDKTNADDLHVIHTMDCTQLPPLAERTLLGYMSSSKDALKIANQLFHTQNFVDCPSCCLLNQKRSFKEVK